MTIRRALGALDEIDQEYHLIKIQIITLYQRKSQEKDSNFFTKQCPMINENKSTIGERTILKLFWDNDTKRK